MSVFRTPKPPPPLRRPPPSYTSPDTDERSPIRDVPAAIADLSRRLGVEAASITVAEDRDVTWPDASLGCPEPGTRYIQRLTEGRLVVLECAGTRHEYHGGPDGTLAYCAVPAPPAHG